MHHADKILLGIFASFVLIIGTLIFVLPQKEYSEAENRYLTKLEAPSISSVLSGEYAKSISSFYSDQFPLRSVATSAYAICEKSMGKKIIGGVINDGERLISIPKANTSEKDIPFPAVIVESKYSLFKEDSGTLSLYYKTDHHRTTKGAYLLYLEAAQKLGIEPYPESFFTKQTVSSDFYGTDFFKSRLPRSMVSPDTIELWRYEGDTNITFTVHDTNESSLGFYDLSKLDTADKYAVFLGGNYALASLYSSPDKPSLLLFKDSYANSVIPFLSLHFNIDLVDPRYATHSQLSSLYNSSSYDYLLFLACFDSFE